MLHRLQYWLASMLYHMFGTCIKTLKTREDAFDALTSRFPKDRTALWEAMDDQPKLVKGTVVSVYETSFANGMQLDDLDN